MKALVIGGSGFLGGHVVDELLQRGVETTVFDLHKPQYPNAEYVKFIEGNMGDEPTLEQAIQSQDFVFIFAGIADIKEAHKDPARTVEVNVLYLTRILSLCTKYRIKRLIYASTIYVYSNMGSFYKASKQCAEILIESFYEEFGLPYSIVRYGSLYGPRANHFNFIHQAIQEALEHGKITRQGDGSELRDYIHVSDAAVATVDQTFATTSNEYIMITGNQTLQVRDVLYMIKEILQNKVEIEFQEGHMEGHYMMTPYFFKPKVAKKIVLNAYHDLGQGILQCIHEVHQELEDRKKEL